MQILYLLIIYAYFAVPLTQLSASLKKIAQVSCEKGVSKSRIGVNKSKTIDVVVELLEGDYIVVQIEVISNNDPNATLRKLA